MSIVGGRIQVKELHKNHCRIVECVSILDGYVLNIIAPCNVGNQKAYYSGHYCCYGVNIQASCDADCRFTFIEVCGPGVMPDRVAIQRSDLWRMLERLPNGYVVIGDAAYPPTEHLVFQEFVLSLITPFFSLISSFFSFIPIRQILRFLAVQVALVLLTFSH